MDFYKTHTELISKWQLESVHQCVFSKTFIEKPATDFFLSLKIYQSYLPGYWVEVFLQIKTNKLLFFRNRLKLLNILIFLHTSEHKKDCDSAANIKKCIKLSNKVSCRQTSVEKKFSFSFSSHLLCFSCSCADWSLIGCTRTDCPL